MTSPATSSHLHAPAASPFSQPKAVWAVAFACVVSFMGIGLVDPILPAIASDLDASPSQVTLLFTSYLVVTAVAMLVTGWVSSRIGAKRTLIAGLAVIVVFAALAGASDSIGQIVGFRAGWGVGNALFIATSLAVIVASASGGFVGAIILYEAALGLGIAVGPLLGGLLGELSWRGPFFGVAALMSIALIATLVLVEPMPIPERKVSVLDPIRALRHRGLLTLSLTALFYNWAFFTVLGYTPFPMDLGAIQLGFVFFAWGLLVALFSVVGAPRLQARFGLARTLYANLALFAVVVLVIAIFVEDRAVLIGAVITAGVFIGINNTVTTQAVMTISPVDRPIASAAYGFVRFIGGGLAPFAAGKMVEAWNIRVPFYIASAALVVAIAILATAHRQLGEAELAQAESVEVPAEAPPAEAPPVEAGRSGDRDPAAVPVDHVVRQPVRVDAETDGITVAAIDASSQAAEVVAAAGRLAARYGRTVHVVHAQESAITPDGAVETEAFAAAQALVRTHLVALADAGVPAVGHVLRHVRGHGAAGRTVAEYANAHHAHALVIGVPEHGGLAALMEESASAELWRHARSSIVIVNPERDPVAV
ncbi:putative MFS family arabinose efflux permease [Mumia flava]|uniref:Putative MFS family arabinose efflux permease n=1 Tax=Mumia flava TaxID=1348852 RepID=A0A0B2B2E6_9ACTN|nr:MFS transporter [Mumia flava]PJJ57878.1 putative MFS family arabinose efflux permease [Mumia flava]